MAAVAYHHTAAAVCFESVADRQTFSLALAKYRRVQTGDAGDSPGVYCIVVGRV